MCMYIVEWIDYSKFTFLWLEINTRFFLLFSFICLFRIYKLIKWVKFHFAREMVGKTPCSNCDVECFAFRLKFSSKFEQMMFIEMVFCFMFLRNLNILHGKPPKIKLGHKIQSHSWLSFRCYFALQKRKSLHRTFCFL